MLLWENLCIKDTCGKSLKIHLEIQTGATFENRNSELLEKYKKNSSQDSLLV